MLSLLSLQKELRQCTSQNSFQQHLRGKRHEKKARREQEDELRAANVATDRKKSKEMMGKTAWKKLLKSENFEKLFAVPDVKTSPKRLMDLLKLSCKKGGTQEFAEVMLLVSESSLRLDVVGFHKLLDMLLLRVPTPHAMVRMLLNLTVHRSEDVVPLVPPTLGFGNDESSELGKLFGPAHEDARAALEMVKIEKLMGRLNIADASFFDYYAHFLILLVLDFMEELAQNQDSLSRPEALMRSGRAVADMVTEPSLNQKSLICSAQHDLAISSGDTVLLCQRGEDPLQASLGYGRVEAVYIEDSKRCLVLSVGGKQAVQQLNQGLLDVYSSVNLTAFERQLAALKKVAASEKKRFPLWDLLPMSGVGGDILDSWAARMRDAVRGGPPPEADTHGTCKHTK